MRRGSSDNGERIGDRAWGTVSFSAACRAKATRVIVTGDLILPLSYLTPRRLVELKIDEFVGENRRRVGPVKAGTGT